MIQKIERERAEKKDIIKFNPNLKQIKQELG
jgi:hypothetical protein